MAGHGGATQTLGKFSLKSLTFGHLFNKNVQKAFSFRGRPPLTPDQGQRAPGPRCGLRPQTARSPWSASLWQILDPPLSVEVAAVGHLGERLVNTVNK